MAREDATAVFGYGTTDAPFISVAGQKLTVALTLTFDPDQNATIKVWALDENCDGGTSSGAVFGYTFRDLTSRTNVFSYDGDAATITFNHASQKALAMGTPRFIWVEVSDGRPEG